MPVAVLIANDFVYTTVQLCVCMPTWAM